MPDQPNPDQIRTEIEAFLRRMSQQKGPTPPPPPPPPTAKKRDSAKPPPRKPLPTGPAAANQPESVTQHVQHLNNPEFAERAAHLTKIEQADAQMEAHLKQAFDHKLGTLDSRHLAGEDASAVPTSPSIADESKSVLVKMLADPSQFRNSIIMSEILRRPEERW